MSKRKPEPVPFKDRYGWRRVEAPRTWRPKEVGAELAGYYGGRTVRDGQWGQYEVAIVFVPDQGAFMVSGVKIMQLLDASLIQKGHPVRVIFEGMKALDEGRRMKVFNLLVADGPAIDAKEMPEVKS